MLCVCTKSLFMYVASYGYSKVLLCRRSTWPAVARGPWCGAFAGSRGDTSTISWQRWRVWIQYDEINGWFLFYMDHHGLWIISIILFHDIISIWSSKWFHYHNIPYYGYGLNPYGYNYCGHLRQVELASTITDKQWVRHHPDPLGGNFLRARSNIVDMPDTVDTVATYGRIHVFLRLRVLAMCWEHPIMIICNIIQLYTTMCNYGRGSWWTMLPTCFPFSGRLG